MAFSSMRADGLQFHEIGVDPVVPVEQDTLGDHSSRGG